MWPTDRAVAWGVVHVFSGGGQFPGLATRPGEMAAGGNSPFCGIVGGMTGLLEEALRRVESLPEEEQDAMAAQIMDTLDDEEAWARSFREKPEVLRSLAREAMEEHRHGETCPLDELLG